MSWSSSCPPPCGYHGGDYSSSPVNDNSENNNGSSDVDGKLNLDAANQLTDEMRQMFDEAAAKQFEITKMQTEGNLSIAAAKSRPNV